MSALICPRCSEARKGHPDGPISLLFPPEYHQLTGWQRATYACPQRVLPWRREDQQANPYQNIVCGSSMMRPATRYEGPEHNRVGVRIRNEIPPITTLTKQFDPDTGILLDERVREYNYKQLLFLWWWLRAALGEIEEKKLKKPPDWWNEVLLSDFRVPPGTPDDPRGSGFVDRELKYYRKHLAEKKIA